ncbi:juvenile hormone esterase-like [Pectinophora gossypiella]|uniref:juvenile hormone esterase-like n=1 Tax=Pectinophora gossypiella TaxID=13191 RepID=UPI00214E3CEE|nr:juvenile hormone esterase-like [Pectinophora gossypiella]
MTQVRVSEGILEGEMLDNVFGGRYTSFKGIPYAEPPIGDLRFKAPQPPKPWNGVRSAKEFGPINYQVDLFKPGAPVGSEDCLYLNVYVPEVPLKKNLPVMVWIHGGGFLWGSGNDDVYGPDFLVRQEVILVTFNYRLGVFGFLCLDTEDVPGNAGMKDQVAALKWVKKNIRQFGGDDENITIFGESAGGASVSYHLVSPMSKGLFQKAICQSGVATNLWSQAFEPRERAENLAKKLGFNSRDDKKLYEFLKTIPKESFILPEVAVTFAMQNSMDLPFVVTSEKDFGQERFLYGDINEKYLNIHEGVDVITGYVEDEGLVGIFLNGALDKTVEKINFFLETMVPLPIARNCPIKEQLDVGREMRNFYFQNRVVTKDDWEQILKFYSMNYFTYNIIELQKQCAKLNKKNKFYLYKFTCKSERNGFKNVFNVSNDPTIIGDKPVVCHCDDLTYLFQVNFLDLNLKKDSKAFRMIEQVTQLWTNFAKYGNPSFLETKWEPFCLEHERYLNIGEELVLESKPEHEEYNFWEKTINKYCPKK